MQKKVKGQSRRECLERPRVTGSARVAAACSAVAVGVALCCTLGSAAARSSIRASPASTGGKYESLAGIPASSQSLVPKSSGKTVRLALGAGKAITIQTGKKLNIAFFDLGTNTTWTVAQNTAVQSQAKKIGASVTEFDGNFDPQAQYSQVQTALTSGKYNAVIVNPVDGQSECNLFTKTAASKNIPVVVVTNPLCNLTGKNGAGAWAPGTANFIGGSDLEAFEQTYFMHIAAQNPKATVAFFTGPPLNGSTINTTTAMKAVERKYPRFHVVVTYGTDYTSATGLKDAQAMLQSNPGVNLIVSTYTQTSAGIVAALKAGNKAKGIKLYNIGSGSTDLQFIRAGTVTMTVPQYPISSGVAAVTSLYRLWNGLSVPRYLGDDGQALPRGAAPDSLLYITKKNVGSVTPQY
jgi:ribose transport system substrate-binding protein